LPALKIARCLLRVIPSRVFALVFVLNIYTGIPTPMFTVTVVIGPWAGRSENRVPCRAETENVFSCRPAVGPTQFLPVGAEGCFVVDRASRGMELTAHGRPVPGFKTRETCYHSPPPFVFMKRCLIKSRDLTVCLTCIRMLLLRPFLQCHVMGRCTAT